MSRYMKTGIIVGAICLCFVIGWYIGKVTIKRDEAINPTVTLTEDVEANPTQAQLTPEATEINSVTTYCIISNNGSIYLYEITNSTRSVITSKSIETELLPSDDREKLAKGIDSDDYSEALKIWEGYVS